jgi:hypothetical protein
VGLPQNPVRYATQHEHFQAGQLPGVDNHEIRRPFLGCLEDLMIRVTGAG